MKHINLRKTLSIATLVSATFVGANALADPPQGAYGQGCGMGPGMMGSGMASGMMGSGMMGPGMMGSGMASGMMGSGMMGPGMMGGQGSGYGMGPGMMGGSGRGPGMMGGYGPAADLNLTAEQRGKISKIRNDARRKRWDLMGKMQDERSQMQELYSLDKRDDAALSKSYRAMSELRNQMFDLSLSAQKQIDAVLTQEQSDKLKRGGQGMHGR